MRQSPRGLSQECVACRPSFSVTVTRAGFAAGTAGFIAGSSAMWMRWRSATMAGSSSAESSTAAKPALPRATRQAATWGNEYFDAK